MISVNVKTGEVNEKPDTPVDVSGHAAWLASEENAKTKRELAKIDAQSIRAMREFILAKFSGDPLLPAVLAGHDSAAAAERAKIKKA